MDNRIFHTGFSLLEMAVVLAVFGLLLTTFLSPLSAQLEARNYAENRKFLSETKNALMGYLAINGHFPCPAVSDGDGSEDRDLATGRCTGNKRNGFLPWSALGLGKLDAWGHLYAYSVTEAYSRSDIPIALNSSPDITIRTRDNAGNLVNLTNASAIPVVVMSYGKNGYFGTSNDGSVIANTSAGNADEVTNNNATTIFISRDISNNTSATGGEFDDVVMWISQGQIVDRLISINKLP